MNDVVKFEGKPRPVSANQDGVSHAQGPQVAADMLCQLRTDAQGLRRALSEIKTQNAEVIAGQSETNRLLALIAEKLDRQHDQAETILVKANENTDKICGRMDKPSK